MAPYFKDRAELEKKKKENSEKNSKRKKVERIQSHIFTFKVIQSFLYKQNESTAPARQKIQR